MTNTIALTTQKAVVVAVESIGLTISGPILAAVSRNCKAEFIDRLSLCVNKDDADGKHRKYLEFLLKCLDPETLTNIQEIVPDATVDEITQAAKLAPVRLMSALQVAMDSTSDRQAEAVELLKSIAAPTSENPPPVPSNEPAPARSSNQPPPQSRDAQRQSVVTADPNKKHFSHHVYGSGFALCFNATEWNGTFGVMVDAATSKGPQDYDWANAIHVWLKPVEIAAVIAVFRKWRKSVEFLAHGKQNDKSFALEFQGTHFFAKVSAKVDGSKTRAVKIMPGDATAVSILFLKQLGAAYEGVDLTELIATVRATHQVDNAA